MRACVRACVRAFVKINKRSFERKKSVFGPCFRTLAGVLVSDSRVWILYGCFESISILCSKPFSMAAFFSPSESEFLME